MSDDSQESGQTKMQPGDTLWVGPAQTEWWRYELARYWVKLRFRVPAIRHIPYVDAITSRALDVTLGSRDTEVVNESNLPDDS